MQMTTSGYISALQGLRALWGWWRKSEDEPDESEHEQRMKEVEEERELALARAHTVRELAEVRAETERIVGQVRTEQRTARLQPVMEMYATLQANKRARLGSPDDDNPV